MTYLSLARIAQLFLCESGHATSRSRRPTTISNLYEWAVKEHYGSMKPENRYIVVISTCQDV